MLRWEQISAIFSERLMFQLAVYCLVEIANLHIEVRRTRNKYCVKTMNFLIYRVIKLARAVTTFYF